jgi:hypothetical protein
VRSGALRRAPLFCLSHMDGKALRLACAHPHAVAVQVRANLDAATRALDRGQREEDAVALEAALAATEASPACAALLGDTLRAARRRLTNWRAVAASEARLQRALRDGVATAALARAVQDASAAGVKVTVAKKTLKVRAVWLEGAARLHAFMLAMHFPLGCCTSNGGYRRRLLSFW